MKTDKAGEASRLISSKAFWINDQLVSDPRRELVRGDVFDKHLVVLKCGKNRAVLYIDFE